MRGCVLLSRCRKTRIPEFGLSIFIRDKRLSRVAARRRQQEGERMSRVRVLAGTKKGAFVLESDGKRDKWEVSGPHFAGWEIYHLKGSPVDPNRIYVSQSSGWFGQLIQRSDDGGKSWHQPGTPAGVSIATGPPKSASNKFAYDACASPLTTHQWYDGTQHPWEF